MTDKTSMASEYAPKNATGIQLSCDIVMKGGITSGIIYPKVAQALSGTFKFRNIGGTSAGAIAAVATAAAELGRATGKVQDSFEALATLPTKLGKLVGTCPQQTTLKSLFAPEPKTTKAFALLTKLVQRRLDGEIVSLVFEDVQIGLTGTLVILAGAWLLSWHYGLGLHSVAWLICSSLILVIVFVVLLLLLIRNTVLVISDNDFGLCSGNSTPGSPNPALTPWMEELFDSLAGINAASPPLTFGDLWKGGSPNFEPDPNNELMPLNPAINLELMTSDLTLGLPVRMPFDLRRYFFRKEDMARFFSSRVVEHLMRHPRTTRDSKAEDYAYFQTLGYYLLPAPADLPVVVAARMSLSFPVLLSAVPLYAVDYTLPVDASKPRAQQRVPEVCWFSDGGITSNFPIHFFDQPLPEWPTFGINLSPFPPGKQADPVDQTKNVYLPPKPSQGGTQPVWTRLVEKKSLPGLFGLMLNTMQNWRDNAQSQLPGYRDRIVTVFRAPDEGGLNLGMSAEIIERLALRGAAAGRILVDAFGDPGTGNRWNAHRWTRFLSFTGMLSATAAQFGTEFQRPVPWGSYEELVKGTAQPAPDCYDISRTLQKTASAFSEALVEANLADRTRSLYAQAPKVRPVLRASPKV
jgi:predicted acylesterase/phospholipase RssA